MDEQDSLTCVAGWHFGATFDNETITVMMMMMINVKMAKPTNELYIHKLMFIF
jgi:hypothetical protein